MLKKNEKCKNGSLRLYNLDWGGQSLHMKISMLHFGYGPIARGIFLNYSENEKYSFSCEMIT